jgi:hypothetical protein
MTAREPGGEASMKKAITTLGCLALAAIGALVALLGILAVIGHSLDRESKAYVDAAVPAIVSDWDVREIRKRAAPEFEEDVDYDELEDLFDALRGLGPLVAYDGASGDSNIMISLQDGCEITADYSARADFEGGTVEMELSLVKHGKQWQLLDIHINPERYSDKRNVV